MHIRRQERLFHALAVIAVVVTATPALYAQTPSPSAGDWSTIEQTLGRKGAAQPGGVIRFGFPRGDLHVATAGVDVKPSLALGSWVAFKRTGSEAMAMGDLV